jgi:hypothetical protein
MRKIFPSPLVGEGRRERSPSTKLRAVSLSNGERGVRGKRGHLARVHRIPLTRHSLTLVSALSHKGRGNTQVRLGAHWRPETQLAK